MLFFDTALASQSKQSKQSKLILAGSNIQPHKKKHLSFSSYLQAGQGINPARRGIFSAVLPARIFYF